MHYESKLAAEFILKWFVLENMPPNLICKRMQRVCTVLAQNDSKSFQSQFHISVSFFKIKIVYIHKYLSIQKINERNVQ